MHSMIFFSFSVMDEGNNFDGPVVVLGAFCWVVQVVCIHDIVGPNLAWTFTNIFAF